MHSDIEIGYEKLAGISPVAPTALSVGDFARSLRSCFVDERSCVSALNDLGNALFHAGSIEHARACYATASENACAFGAKASLGRCELRLGRATAAESLALEVLSERADFAPALLLLSDALDAQNRLLEAIEAIQKAILQGAPHFALHRRLGELYEKTKNLESAAAEYAKAFSINQRDLRSLVMLVFAKRNLCDWHGLDTVSRRLVESAAGSSGDISPFEFLAEGASAKEQLMVAGSRARAVSAAVLSPTSTIDLRPVAKNAILRVGFVSHGFGSHPTSLLTAAVFEQLVPLAVEVHLFSTRPPEDSAQRRRIVAAVDAFHDVSTLSAPVIAAKVRDLTMDILVDLDGYTRSRSPAVFAHRPAPIQVNWLAYPGTTGASYMDYIVADRFVLPESLQPFFSEKEAYLPRCYQSSDTSRMLADAPSRAMCGLPPQGVVYACFNASFKINPRSFRRMISVLAQVPGSVLWLLKGPGQADDRLRKAASAMGVDRSRLVFMDRLPRRDYLSRYQHAELFLDTEHYNAHTVASDALRAGCPVLTRPGETFASRVAGSLNHYLGMDELNVDSDTAFIALAVCYGLDASYRSNVRQRLAQQIRESSHFDMPAYARDFVSLLARMVSHHRSGGTPESFSNDVPD